MSKSRRAVYTDKERQSRTTANGTSSFTRLSSYIAETRCTCERRATTRSARPSIEPYCEYARPRPSRRRIFTSLHFTRVHRNMVRPCGAFEGSHPTPTFPPTFFRSRSLSLSRPSVRYLAHFLLPGNRRGGSIRRINISWGSGRES